jgi:hypothetical protein
MIKLSKLRYFILNNTSNNNTIITVVARKFNNFNLTY